MPEPSDWLDEHAKALYREAVALLEQSGSLRPADAPTIEDWAHNRSTAIRYTIELRQSGEVIRNPNGAMQADPRTTLRDNAQRIAAMLARSLGMTPTDKSRVKKEPVKKANPFLK